MIDFQKATHLCDTCINYIVQKWLLDEKSEPIVTRVCKLTLDCTPKMLECSEYDDGKAETKELLSTRNQQRRAYWQGAK